jgi:predicted NUDIX family phosphoesterase
MTRILTIPTIKYLDRYNDDFKKLINTTGTFTERAEAETDFTKLQIIPYIVVTQNDNVFTYTRLKKGGEARLHSKKSIGIGGHVEVLNPIESNYDTYQSNMYKELFEELDIEYNDQFLDIKVSGESIYDPSNEVGRVHLGLLCYCDVTNRKVSVKETEKIAGDFITKKELSSLYKDNPNDFENWSVIAMQRMGIIQ